MVWIVIPNTWISQYHSSQSRAIAVEWRGAEVGRDWVSGASHFFVAAAITGRSGHYCCRHPKASHTPLFGLFWEIWGGLQGHFKPSLCFLWSESGLGFFFSILFLSQSVSLSLPTPLTLRQSSNLQWRWDRRQQHWQQLSEFPVAAVCSSSLFFSFFLPSPFVLCFFHLLSLFYLLFLPFYLFIFSLLFSVFP